ncbi:MAG: hypothetical protein ACREBU_22065 [Nitrososphaera sp.]
MEQKDRLAILAAMLAERPSLQQIDNAGVAIQTWFAFIAKTDPKPTASRIKQFIDESDPEFYVRVIPPSTIDRDRRRPIGEGSKGLNEVWREHSQKLANYF